MKVSKILLNTITLAVTLGTTSSCRKSGEGKPTKQPEAKEGKTESFSISAF